MTYEDEQQVTLRDRVAFLRSQEGLDIQMNYDTRYGGYNITTNKGATILMHRNNAKSANIFLDGMVYGSNNVVGKSDNTTTEKTK
tara:strand:+ start:225 stop:479 length:255 start_codon:yes stop_codon:yes gene_type:complete